MGTPMNKTINDLVKEAIEGIANDQPELETPTTNEKGDVK
jgi:hypothetical protein